MLPRMNKEQQHQAKKLIEKLCCNYFRVAVLPTEPVLEAELIAPDTLSLCKNCKRPYVKKRYNQLFCKECSKLRYKKQQAEYSLKRRLKSRKSAI